MKLTHHIAPFIALGALATSTTPVQAAPQFDEIEAQHRSFGLIAWPWVTEIGEGDAFHRFTWLAEDGGRIRFRPGVDGPWFQSEHQPDADLPAARRHDGIYRDLEVFQPFADLDQWCGVAVGEKGQWSWWMGDLLDPEVDKVKWNDLAPVALPSFFETESSATVHEIFEVDIVVDQPGSDGPRFWMVGEDHLIGYCTVLADPAGSFVKSDLVPYPNVSGGVSALRTISFAPDGLSGIAAGDTVAYFTEDGGEIWEPSTVNGVAGFAMANVDTVQIWSSVLDRTLNNGKWEGFLVGGIALQGGQYMLRTTNGGRSFSRQRQQCDAPGQTNCASLDPCATLPQDSCTGSTWAFGNGAPLLEDGSSATTTLYTVHRYAGGNTIAGGYLNQTLLLPGGTPGQFSWDDVTGFCGDDIDQTTLWGLHGAPNSDYVIGVGAWGAIKSSTDFGHTWTAENSYRRWRFNAIDVVANSGTESTVYLAGQNLRVARSDDSGRTWDAEKERGVLSQAPADAKAFGSTMLGVAVFDAGTTFPDDDIVVAVGFLDTEGSTLPYVLHSSNGGGDCFSAVDLSSIVPGSVLSAVAFNQDATSSADLVFFATTFRGEVLRSTDLGATWTLVADFVGRLECLAVPTQSTAIFGGRDSAGRGHVWLMRNLKSSSPAAPSAVDLLATLPSVQTINDVVVNGLHAFACGAGGELWDLGVLPRLQPANPLVRTVASQTSAGSITQFTPVPQPTRIDLSSEASFLTGRNLLSLGIARGRGEVQLLVGSTGGRMCMVAGQRGSYSVKRVHSGVSNDIEDIEFRSRATGSSEGRAFIVSQTDAERKALGGLAVLFGSVAQPTLLEVVFSLSDLP